MMISTCITLLQIIILFGGPEHARGYKRCALHCFSNRIQEDKVGEYEVKSKALKKLYERKLIHYVSDIKNIDRILYENEKEKEKKNRKSVYVGIDLNCKYLHIGNLIPLITLGILRNNNTNIIILLGSSTTKIGDPSFQNVERKRTVDEEIYENEKNIRSNIIRLFLQKEMNEKKLNEIIERSNNVFEDNEFIYESDTKGSLIILKNSLWYNKINIIDFLKYGEYFSINKLLRKECFLNKSCKNLTLKDMNYVTLQSYDFLYLFQKYQTLIQVGGSDQWGNIQSGIELCQNIFNKQLYGLTTNLLIHKNNNKYSKSLFNENRKLPIWVDKNFNPPYLFWNFLRNIDDVKLQSYIDMLTNLNMNIHEQVIINRRCSYTHKVVNDSVSVNRKVDERNMQSIYDEQINKAKTQLANSVTSYVYGEEVVNKIHKMNKMMKYQEFDKIENVDDLKIFPFIEINTNDLNNNKINIIHVLRNLEIANTNKEAKEKIGQKCLYLNKLLIDDPKFLLSIENFVQVKNNSSYYAILRLGKKTCYSIIVK
ncbi:tyrosine--tRNA ligase, putative [Plasmodium malariae]|uniref:Tyrosine--tRNA ligase n=2 Tax=Plasmodium (Plasmodium) TaxID=418103 RepID=A0A1A8W0C4_PLAMA|nr:tyrosine--tRNA ligase, putative [Plasmodium malariae]SBS85396.1 tyrosine--tRNA ligase [Plasmodium malariae]SCN12695.1 tyrosine--tRNA ligase, putative [Plasmodium malariae]